MNRPLLIEGYAALFGVPDCEGDIVRAGAFSRALRERPMVAMLLQHRSGAIAGRWLRVVEDATGLFVRGLIEAPGACTLVEQGLDGLSIGFWPRLWKPRAPEGRELITIDLAEVSLVAEPCQPRARFRLVGAAQVRAA